VDVKRKTGMCSATHLFPVYLRLSLRQTGLAPHRIFVWIV